MFCSASVSVGENCVGVNIQEDTHGRLWCHFVGDITGSTQAQDGWEFIEVSGRSLPTVVPRYKMLVIKLMYIIWS